MRSKSKDVTGFEMETASVDRKPNCLPLRNELYSVNVDVLLSASLIDFFRAYLAHMNILVVDLKRPQMEKDYPS
jgi:hypothetical protein